MSELEQVTHESAIDRLRRKRNQRVVSTTIDLPIAGYGGELVARYRMLDPLTEGKEIGERVRGHFKDDETAVVFYVQLDGLIAANVGLFLKGTNGLEPLSPDDEPMTYGDSRVAEGLGIEDVMSARELLLALFDGNKVALLVHADKYARWMSDPEGFSGEA